MAITLEANYSKKIGLAGYSSHQFSVTIKTEIADVGQAQAESNRLYHQLQESVDNSIREIGWLPTTNGNGNGHSQPAARPEMWACTPKQRELILKIVAENNLDKNEVEALAQERFNQGVKLLNTLQASQIIGELLEKYPGKRNGNGNGHYQRSRFNQPAPTKAAA